MAQYLKRSQYAGNQRTFTVSVWVKNNNWYDFPRIFSIGDGSGNYMSELGILNNTEAPGQSIRYLEYNNGTPQVKYVTNSIFIDGSHWFNITLAVDTTLSNSFDRVKIWVDGERVTDFRTSGAGAKVEYSLNRQTFVNGSTYDYWIGRSPGYGHTWDGGMHDYYHIDGQALDPSYFCKTDTNGKYRPKSPQGVVAAVGSFGANGFYLPLQEDQDATGQLINQFNSDTVTLNGNTVVGGRNKYSQGAVSQPGGGTLGWTQIPPNSDMDVGTGDFTFEAWVSINKDSPTNSYWPSIITLGGDNNHDGYITNGALGWWITDASKWGIITNNQNGNNSGWYRIEPLTTIDPRDGKYHHIATSRTTGTIRYFVDGVQYDTRTDNNNYNAGATYGIAIGTSDQWSVGMSCDSLRLIKGQGLYNSNFTPGDILTTNGISGTVAALFGPTARKLSSSRYVGEGFDKVDNPVITPDSRNLNLANNNVHDMQETPGGYSNGGLTVSNTNNTRANMGFKTGKFYAEYKIEASSVGVNHLGASLMNVPIEQAGWSTGDFILWRQDGRRQYDGVQDAGYTSYTDGNIVSILIDADNRTITFWKDGATVDAGLTNLAFNNEITDALDNNEYITFITRPNPTNCSTTSNFGQGTFVTSNNGQGYSDDDGNGKYQYQPPAGYKTLCAENVDSPVGAGLDPETYFTVTDYSGTGNYDSITTGNAPDLLMIKAYSGADAHHWRVYDSARSATSCAPFHLNQTTAEDYFNDDPHVQFDNNGFTMVAGNGNNGIARPSTNYIAYGWTGNRLGSANSSGSINSTTYYNSTSGFSIVKYTGNGTFGATVGHGMTNAPKFMFIRNLSSGNSTPIYHKETSNVGNSAVDVMYLNNTTKGTSDNIRNVNSNTFTLTSWGGTNGNSHNMIAYCWEEIEGFSKFGKYVANGQKWSEAPYIYTGFKPALLIIRRLDASRDWYVIDNKRPGYNNRLDNGGQVDNFGSNYKLITNGSGFQQTAFHGVDLHTNGFSLLTAESAVNADGGSYIYMAWAESPFKEATMHK